MLKRLLIILVTSLLLLNSVCATAHIAGNDHTNKHSPDLHLDAYHYADIHQQDESSEAEQSSSEHKRHSHCHTNLQVFIISTEFQPVDFISHNKAITHSTLLTSLSHSPPVPPPTL
jgi:hypothetical protein